MEIHSAPVPGAVFVDGTYRGVAPVEVGGLAPGHHYVTVLATGYDLAQSSQPAGLGTAVELTLSPSPAEKGLLEILKSLKTTVPPGSGGSGGALARWAGADEVLVAGLQKKGEGTSAVVSRFAPDGKSLASLEKTLGRPEAIEDLAREVFAASSTAAPTAALPPPPPPAMATEPAASTSRSSSGGLGTGRTIGIAVGAVAVASLGAGVGLGFLAGKKAEDARSAPLVDYDSLRSQAHSFAIGADVLYGVAAVGAGIATWLIITGGPKASGDAPPPAKDATFSLAPVAGGAVFSVSGGF